MTGDKKTLRSAGWFGDEWHQGFVSRGWTKNQGHPEQMFDGRPVIGICNTWSDLNPCNAHLRILAEQVKRGVYEAGGFPLEFPVTSLGETLMKPTTMLYRNLASMDVEESIRANPLDGVVLLTGCDKTTPACLMGAASVDLPTIAVTGGPMLNGKFRNENIGSGTDVYRFTTELRAGSISRLDYSGGRGRDFALGRPLHDHGHGLDNGLHGRDCRADAAERRGDSRAGCAAQALGTFGGQSHRRDG